MDRRITQYAGDWIDVDPTNDSVVISEREAGTTTYTGRRISSATGKTIASINFHNDVRRIAIDEQGRMFAISPFYGTFNSLLPCVVDRLGAGGGIAVGVDTWLETCEERGVDPGLAYFGDAVAIEIGRDGRLLIVDEAEAGVRRGDEAAGLGFTVLTPGFAFVRHWHIPLEWGLRSAPFGPWSQSLTHAGSSAGVLYLGETIISDDGIRSTGSRVRVFDASGELQVTFGVGGDSAGVTWPTHPNVDARDRLWVIDQDLATRSFSIKVLE